MEKKFFLFSKKLKNNMPRNLEFKIKLSNHKKVLEEINKLKAVFVDTINQKDIYYRHPDCLLKLRIEGERQTLIYYHRNEMSNKRWSDYKIIHLTNANAEKYFAGIFKTEAIVQKKRDLYLYDNTRIHLDKVKGLGYFLELETLVLSGNNDAVRRFNFILNELKLDTKKELRTSYRNLIMQK